MTDSWRCGVQLFAWLIVSPLKSRILKKMNSGSKYALRPFIVYFTDYSGQQREMHPMDPKAHAFHRGRWLHVRSTKAHRHVQPRVASGCMWDCVFDCIDLYAGYVFCYVCCIWGTAWSYIDWISHLVVKGRLWWSQAYPQHDGSNVMLNQYVPKFGWRGMLNRTLSKKNQQHSVPRSKAYRSLYGVTWEKDFA